MNEFNLIYGVILSLSLHFNNFADEVLAEAVEAQSAIEGSDLRVPEKLFNVEHFTNVVGQEAIRKTLEFCAVYCQSRDFQTQQGGGNVLGQGLSKSYEIHVDVAIPERGQIPEQVGLITEAVTRSIMRSENEFSNFSHISVTGKYPSQYPAGRGGVAGHLLAGAVLTFKIGA